MDSYSYAHNDTSKDEKKSCTAPLNKVRLPDCIEKLRESAFSRGIPTADGETTGFLKNLVLAVKPENILELGTAVGISGAVMLFSSPSARLTTIERDEKFYREACANFSSLGLDGRVCAVLGDAGEEIQKLDKEYDFIFLDCAKVQYVKYLPRLKQLLKKGGTLVADDVLLYGWITGETPVPPKRRMLCTHVREYLDAVTSDEELGTTILNIGDGVALSVKI